MTGADSAKLAKIIPRQFKADMARALWDGTKTETRRVAGVELLPGVNSDFSGLVAREEGDGVWRIYGSEPASKPFKVPYVVGALIPVREPWRVDVLFDELSPRHVPDGAWVEYLANPPKKPEFMRGRYRQGMHMPYQFSRMVLEIIGVSVERLQSITEAAAKAEGVRLPLSPDGRPMLEMGLGSVAMDYLPARAGAPSGESVSERTARVFKQAWTYRLHYAALWDRINAKRGYPWAANDWVVAVRFKVHKANILTFQEGGT